MIKRLGVVAFGCVALHFDVMADIQIKCQIINYDAVLEVAAASHLKQVRLKQKPEVCELGFDFAPATNHPTTGVLRIAPSVLGLNAQNEVFRISFIQGDSIAISPDSLELVTGGTVCTDVVDKARVREIESNGNCKKSIKASYEAPVCLVHHGLTTAVSSLDRCAMLSDLK